MAVLPTVPYVLLFIIKTHIHLQASQKYLSRELDFGKLLIHERQNHLLRVFKFHNKKLTTLVISGEPPC